MDQSQSQIKQEQIVYVNEVLTFDDDELHHMVSDFDAVSKEMDKCRVKTALFLDQYSHEEYLPQSEKRKREVDRTNLSIELSHLIEFLISHFNRYLWDDEDDEDDLEDYVFKHNQSAPTLPVPIPLPKVEPGSKEWLLLQ